MLQARQAALACWYALFLESFVLYLLFAVACEHCEAVL
jgi:hypothetical protein